jgi:hypothetical protein
MEPGLTCGRRSSAGTAPSTHALDPNQITIKEKGTLLKMHNEWQMTGWELTRKKMAENEVSTNLVHLNVHDPISAIVVLKIKHAEECIIILRVLCWHIDMWKSLFWNIKERRSSKQLKSIIKPFTDLDKNGCVMPALVILLFLVLRIHNFNLSVYFVDTIHSPMCIVEHMYEYL